MEFAAPPLQTAEQEAWIDGMIAACSIDMTPNATPTATKAKPMHRYDSALADAIPALTRPPSLSIANEAATRPHASSYVRQLEALAGRHSPSASYTVEELQPVSGPSPQVLMAGAVLDLTQLDSDSGPVLSNCSSFPSLVKVYGQDKQLELSRVPGLASATKIDIQRLERLLERGARPDQSPSADHATTVDASPVPRSDSTRIARLQAGVSLLIILGMLVYTGYDTITRYIRERNPGDLALMLMFPLDAALAAFFVKVLVSSIWSFFLPVTCLARNSRTYSIMPPNRNAVPPSLLTNLPLVTVQIPVYKESFADVVKPTLESVFIACETYRSQGGSYNLLVHDDGILAGLDAQEQLRRIQYYAEHNIAWVARPAAGRKGRFKKASNLNFGMVVCEQLRTAVADFTAVNPESDPATVRHQLLSDMAVQGGYLADGPLQLGDYIVLLDCDSRMPADSLLDCVIELEQAPEVAFLQHATEPMQVVHDYWEDAIAFFTSFVYGVAIRFGCSTGEASPLVGHNAVLRWSALQRVSSVDASDQQRKYWSEQHVSEDFDLSIRLAHGGYIGRYICYQPGWTEGVSLCVRDEITRLQKYAFGAAEVLFNPLPQWWSRGVLGSSVQQLLHAPLGFEVQFVVLAYLCTYLAMALAPVLCLLTYFAQQYVDVWRLHTYNATQWMSIALVFTVVSPLADVFRGYRAGHHSLLGRLLTTLAHNVLLYVFWSGIMLHLTGAVAARMLNVDMVWTSTVKEVQLTNFFTELRRTLHTYRWMYTVVGLSLLLVVAMHPAFNQMLDTHTGWTLVPADYWVGDLWAVYGMVYMAVAHAVMPLLLNPVLMRITF